MNSTNWKFVTLFFQHNSLFVCLNILFGRVNRKKCNIHNYKNNIFILFFLAVLLTSILEYFTGLFLEKTFKTKWWDYTEDPFNIHGRVCLLYSLMWGVGEVIIIRLIHPILNNLVMDIPGILGDIVLSLIIVYFIIDLCFTLFSLMEYNSYFCLQLPN